MLLFSKFSDEAEEAEFSKLLLLLFLKVVVGRTSANDGIIAPPPSK
jgi:hypothetical protein